MLGYTISKCRSKKNLRLLIWFSGEIKPSNLSTDDERTAFGYWGSVIDEQGNPQYLAEKIDPLIGIDDGWGEGNGISCDRLPEYTLAEDARLSVAVKRWYMGVRKINNHMYETLPAFDLEVIQTLNQSLDRLKAKRLKDRPNNYDKTGEA